MIPEKIKSWRFAKGITQRVAAKTLGVSLRTYQSYEIGERPIPKPIAKIVEAYT